MAAVVIDLVSSDDEADRPQPVHPTAIDLDSPSPQQFAAVRRHGARVQRAPERSLPNSTPRKPSSAAAHGLLQNSNSASGHLSVDREYAGGMMHHSSGFSMPPPEQGASDESDIEDLTTAPACSKRKRSRSPDDDVKARDVDGGGYMPARSRVPTEGGHGGSVGSSVVEDEDENEDEDEDEDEEALNGRRGGKRESKDAAKERRAKEREACKLRKERDKEQTKCAKAEAREERRIAKEARKAADKARKCEERETKARTGGKDSLQHVRISVDHRLGKEERMERVVAELDKELAGQTRLVTQALDAAITFERLVFVILYLRPQQLVHLTNTKALVPWVEQAVAFYPSQCAPLVLVLGLEEYLSKHGGGGGGGRHAQGDKRVLHDMVTDSLAEMLVALGVAWRAVECEDEVVQVILRMARAIAQEPYRDPISVVHLYRDSKASAGRSNSLSSGMEALFQAIPGIGEACAKACAQAYPNLRALARHYKQVANMERQNEEHGEHDKSKRSEHLLEQLVFEGSCTSTRNHMRVGPKRSQRLHVLFHSRDPFRVISTLTKGQPSETTSV